jgi:hypothetical protein
VYVCAYQIGERVQLLPHHAALLPPARDLAVEEVEEEAKGQEAERRPQVAVLCWVAEAVAHRGEEGEDAAEACRGENISRQLLLSSHARKSGQGCCWYSPFSSVIRSAKCSARMSEKWPASVESRTFCLSVTAVGRQRSVPLFLRTFTVGGKIVNILGGLLWRSSFEAAPFATVALVRLDMLLTVGVLFTACGVSSGVGGRGCEGSRDF